MCGWVSAELSCSRLWDHSRVAPVSKSTLIRKTLYLFHSFLSSPDPVQTAFCSSRWKRLESQAHSFLACSLRASILLQAQSFFHPRSLSRLISQSKFQLEVTHYTRKRDSVPPTSAALIYHPFHIVLPPRLVPGPDLSSRYL